MMENMFLASPKAKQKLQLLHVHTHCETKSKNLLSCSLDTINNSIYVNHTHNTNKTHLCGPLSPLPSPPPIYVYVHVDVYVDACKNIAYVSVFLFPSLSLFLCLFLSQMGLGSYVHFRPRPCSSTWRWAGSQPTDTVDHAQSVVGALMHTFALRPPHVCHRQETGQSPLTRTCSKTWGIPQAPPHLGAPFPLLDNVHVRNPQSKKWR